MSEALETDCLKAYRGQLFPVWNHSQMGSGVAWRSVCIERAEAMRSAGKVLEAKQERERENTDMLIC